MKKLQAILLVIALILALCIPSAAQQNGNTEEIKNVVQNYLSDFSRNALLYEENDLSTYSVAAAPMIMDLTEDEATSFEYQDGAMTLSEMEDNAIFLEEKADFFCTSPPAL